MCDYAIVGVVTSDSGEVVNIVSRDLDGFEMKELCFNNDPYGIVLYSGLADKELRAIKELEEVNEKIVQTKEYQYARSIVEDKLKGDFAGVIFLKDGMLLIREPYYFEAVLEKADGEVEAYLSEVYVSDMEDDGEISEELLAVLGIG